jgi:hypothetical protein
MVPSSSSSLTALPATPSMPLSPEAAVFSLLLSIWVERYGF